MKAKPVFIFPSKTAHNFRALTSFGKDSREAALISKELKNL
jgi:hypothetical protein